MNKPSLSAAAVCAIAWGSALLFAGFGLAAWASSFGWRFGHIDSYSLFPVFGLVAYGLMVSHYLAATVRQVDGQDKAVLGKYFHTTSILVLLLIIAHPGLLIWQLYRDGLGLPPASYLRYVGRSLETAVLFGTVSWLAFMAYETRRWFEKQAWWKFVSYASDIAMILIFFHAIMLGSQLRIAWFRDVWYGYGLIVVVGIVYNIWQQLTNRPKLTD